MSFYLKLFFFFGVHDFSAGYKVGEILFNQGDYFSIVRTNRQPTFTSGQSPTKLPLVRALEPYENFSATPTGPTRSTFRARRRGGKSSVNENRDSTNDKRMNTSQ